MDWDDVRFFLALTAARNLAAASTQLGCDRSTISRRITTLEEKLGARLFTRTRDGLRPTATATRLLPHAERMALEAATLTRAAANKDDGSARGLVRLATTEGLAAFLVGEGLLDVRRAHPSLEIEILSGNRPLDLQRGEADLALRLAPLRQSSLRVRCVARMGVGLFASPAYLRERGNPRSVSKLSGHDILLPSGDLAQLPESRWLRARPLLHVAFRASSMPALIAAAERGLGLVPLPLGWGDANRALERVLDLSMLPERSLWLVTPADTQPAVRIVADAVDELCRRALPRRG
jgi:DNA-binding transcriptional LysR family regulator